MAQVETKTVFSRTPPPGQDPWAVTPDILAAAEQISQEIEQSRREREKRVLPCPYDGSPSRFLKRKGYFTRGFAIFKCDQKGHEFQVG